MPIRDGPYRQVNPTTLILITTLFIFFSCNLINSYYRVITKRLMNNDWDLIIFTQNWPVSVCLAWEEKYKENSCLNLEKTDSWTIHGIWPTKLGTIGPAFCNTSRPFDPAAIYGIQDELEKQWAPVERHSKKNMLWQHEWDKHGTCAAVLPQLDTEFKYFYKGLTWNQEYNMTEVLEKAKIVPGYKYNLTDIFSGVKLVLGKNPHIACFTDSISKMSYLLEVRICFDKNLTLTDCDGIKSSRYRAEPYYTGCSPNKPVNFPLASPYPPVIPKLPLDEPFLIDLYKFIQLLRWATS